jgi:hypothetical protein
VYNEGYGAAFQGRRDPDYSNEILDGLPVKHQPPLGQVAYGATALEQPGRATLKRVNSTLCDIIAENDPVSTRPAEQGRRVDRLPRVERDRNVEVDVLVGERRSLSIPITRRRHYVFVSSSSSSALC